MVQSCTGQKEQHVKNIREEKVCLSKKKETRKLQQLFHIRKNKTQTHK